MDHSEEITDTENERFLAANDRMASLRAYSDTEAPPQREPAVLIDSP